MGKSINDKSLGGFVHLHLHSDYSILDSSLKIPELIERAKKFGMSAVALTDYWNIMGGIKFYKEARKHGIKPIIGAEIDDLILLVKNDIGYKNLSKILTAYHLYGFNKNILEENHDGLIAISLFIKGDVSQYLLSGQEKKAYDRANLYKKLFKDDYYIEVQNHNLKDQLEIIPQLVKLSEKINIPLVATNNVHYLEKEDADAVEILKCMKTDHVLGDPDRPEKIETKEMYFKSKEEMKTLFVNNPQWLDTTEKIAEKCKFEFKLGKQMMPIFSVPKEFTIDEYFEKICRDAFDKLKKFLLNKRHNIEIYEKRLNYEINQIKKMGFAGYFLIIRDIIMFSNENNIPVGPGRGSAPGSLVLFVMGITKINPLEYDLLFERFINLENPLMPDIDIDFETERRSEIINYIREEYGEENTTQIITFGKMKTKMAIRDIGKVMGISRKTINKITGIIPDGPKTKIIDEINTNTELREAMNRKPEIKKMIELSAKIENNIRHTSMHAAATLISPQKISEFLPLYKTKNDIITQFDKDDIKGLGLIEMDILGLKTLTMIQKTLNQISKQDGNDIDLYNIPMDDKSTFEIFQKGETDGVFQFESSGMRDLLKAIKPEKFEDLIAINALYRPGPLNSGMADAFKRRKNGKEKIIYVFSELEPILKNTYGLIIYQEQLMQIFETIAGFSLGKANEMRIILAKRIDSEIPELKKMFLTGAIKNGFDKEKAELLFSQMKEFAPYLFNKSHSVSYAILAYQTAYLKAHYNLN